MEISVNRINKSYNGVKVLRDITFDVKQGQKLSIYGPSGCGKTTLLHIISGLQKPDSGSIHGMKGMRISAVFQEARLLPWKTAVENVQLVLMKQAGNEAERWLEMVGLKDDLHKYPDELSGGMQQRIAIARALAYDGDIFLFDEPFKGLDEQMKATIMELCKRTIGEKTLIMITHTMEEACAMTDSMLYYNDEKWEFKNQV